ncbi:MAG: cupin domain-containing protein [Alphaproteobacteria bacterium]|nr:cupin domain-containing protein [Alphaproteobacteria bacterium]
MPKPTLPAIDPATVAEKSGTGYPEPFRALVKGRHRRRLGDALGLRNFGVNMTRLEPGAASAQRHWHERQDEFVMILEGELVLVTNGGEQTLEAGMVAGFPAGAADGHHLINRTGKDAVYLEVGDRMPGDAYHYPDIDMFGHDDGPNPVFLHRDGKPW